jgi:polar amino acid transport system substrate-binding protein
LITHHGEPQILSSTPAGSLALALLAVGVSLWLAERRRNAGQFPASPREGIANGVWLALVTMTTVGYGDVHAAGQLARGITTVQLVFDVIFIAAFARLLTRATGAGIRERNRDD